MNFEYYTTITGLTLITHSGPQDIESMNVALAALSQEAGKRKKIIILEDVCDKWASQDDQLDQIAHVILGMRLDKLIIICPENDRIRKLVRGLTVEQDRIFITRDRIQAITKFQEIANKGSVTLYKGARPTTVVELARDFAGAIGPTRLHVNLDSIAHNIQAIKSKVAPDVRLMAVVKSFGYGHGSVWASRIAMENGVNNLAVAFPDEAVYLREKGINAKILVFNLHAKEEATKLLRYDLSVGVPSLEIAKALNESNTNGGKINVHIKVDTGMGRSGVWFEDAVPFIKEVVAMKNLRAKGIMTHFSSADDPRDDDYTLKQIEAFKELLKDLEKQGIVLDEIHAANTAAIVRFPESHFNMVRPGLGVYGMYPSGIVKNLIDLEPIITFSSKITQIKEHPPGRSISYGRRFVTNRLSRLATLPVGYNDGYPRFQSNIGEVLVKGKRTPVVGTVCMDAIMVDITDIPDVAPGDEAVLIGKQGNQEIDIDEIASNGDTINYEIACKISPRVNRIFVRSRNPAG